MKKNLNKLLYKFKIKFKFMLYTLLGLLTLIAVLCIAYTNQKLIETSITIILFFIFRNLYVKQYHAKSLILCALISIIAFIFIILIELRLNTSILFSVLTAFMITLISYYVKDYLDNKEYINTVKLLKQKSIHNLTLNEMYDLMPNINKEILDIVYGYLHKDRTITAYAYAMSKNISEPLIYKYVKKVKDTYKSL